MRVLHVAATVSVADGLSTAVLTSVRALRTVPDMSVKLLVGQYSGIPLNKQGLRESGVETSVVPVSQPWGGVLGSSIAYPRGFGSTLHRLLVSADLVHFHGLWLYPTLLGCPILRRQGIPYVISPHGFLLAEALQRGRLKKRIALRFFERRNLQSAAAVTADSAAELRQMASTLGDAQNARVVPLAVDPATIRFFSERVRRGAVLRRGRTLLCVSRFHSQKMLVELVHAFASAAEAAPGYVLRIVGGDDERGYRDKVIEAVRARGLTDRVIIEGIQTGERLWTAYAEADIFVLPSSFESFGMVIAEALAASLPVIATRGAPWPQIEAEGCGWWIDPSARSLEIALRRALTTEPWVLQEMGERGRQLVVNHFSGVALGARLTELYRQLSAG